MCQMDIVIALSPLFYCNYFKQCWGSFSLVHPLSLPQFLLSLMFRVPLCHTLQSPEAVEGTRAFLSSTRCVRRGSWTRTVNAWKTLGVGLLLCQPRWASITQSCCEDEVRWFMWGDGVLRVWGHLIPTDPFTAPPAAINKTIWYSVQFSRL